jgi:hypothetical protein
MATNQINSTEVNQFNENAARNAKVAAAMLFAAASPSLQALSRCLEKRDWENVVTQKFVNEVAHNKISEKNEAILKDGAWVSEVFEALKWWQGVTLAISLGCLDLKEYERERPQKSLKKANAYLNDVLALYPEALEESLGYPPSGCPAGAKLIKSYWLYTYEVMECASEVWYAVDTMLARSA